MVEPTEYREAANGLSETRPVSSVTRAQATWNSGHILRTFSISPGVSQIESVNSEQIVNGE